MSTASSRPDGIHHLKLDDEVPADLLIIGGGVFGLSVACEVLARGLSVTLFDGDPRLSATWAAAGMLSPYAEHAERDAMQDMLRAARVAYPAYVARIEEHSGTRIELAFPGTIVPALGPGHQQRLQELAGRYQNYGACSRYLTPDEAARMEPHLGLVTSGAILLEEEGYANPQTLHVSLLAAFDRLGGRLVRLPVLGLVSRQGRVVGVETAVGTVMGGCVVNASGAWADRFLLPEDQERHRTRPIRGQLVRLRPPTYRDGIRHVIQLLEIGYLVPRADGTVVVGATSENVGPFPVTTMGGIRFLLETARRIIPSSETWEFVSASAGLRPMAGDGELVLEPDSARKGLFHGLGLYRHGILLAPVAATRMCRMVLEYLGRTGQ